MESDPRKWLYPKAQADGGQGEEEDLDLDNENYGRKKRQRVGGQNDYSEPMSFVSSSSRTEQETKPPSVDFKKASQNRTATKSAPVKLDRNFGSFEKFTKGIGLKYLQKFGFQGRLGKNEQGISAPIAVKVRPKNVGLGLISEANELPENKKVERELGRTGDKENIEAAKLKKEQDEFDKSLKDLWKRSTNRKKQGRNGETSFTATDSSRTEMKVIDMTGFITGESKTSINYIRSIADADKMKLENLEHRKDYLNSETLSLRIVNLEKSQNTNSAKIENFRTVLELLKECNKNSLQKSKDATDTVRDLKFIWKEYPEYIEMFDLDKFAVSIADRCTEKWSTQYTGRVVGIPLELPENLRNYVNLWRQVLPSDSRYRDLLETMLEQHLLPKLVRILNNSFEDCIQGDGYDKLVNWATEIMSYFKDKGFKSLNEAITDRAIVPKLKSYVSSWGNTRKRGRASHSNSGEKSLDVAIHPWLPFMRKRIRENLHRDVRRKLEKAISGIWKCYGKAPSNISVSERLSDLVSPWKDVFSKQTLDKLIENSIIPGMEDVISSLLIINPRNQDDKPFRIVIESIDLIGNDRCSFLLEAYFFPRWLSVLKKWLTSVEDVTQPEQWFSAWRTQFPRKLLDNSKMVRNHFDVALTWISSRREHKSLNGAVPDESTYQAVVESLSQEEETAQHEPSKSKEKEALVHRFSDYRHSRRVFKDLVEAIAESMGVLFMRHERMKTVNGNLLYVLNGKEVYFHESESVLCARQTEKNAWLPIELQTLLSFE